MRRRAGAEHQLINNSPTVKHGDGSIMLLKEQGDLSAWRERSIWKNIGQSKPGLGFPFRQENDSTNTMRLPNGSFPINGVSENYVNWIKPVLFAIAEYCVYVVEKINDEIRLLCTLYQPKKG